MDECIRYLTISRKDRRGMLYVAGAGCDFERPHDAEAFDHPEPYLCPWSRGRRVRDLYAVNLHVRGITEFESDDAGQTQVRPGSLVFLFPQNSHRYRAASRETLSHYWVWFGGDYGRYLIERCGASVSKPILPVGESVALQASYLALVDRLVSEPPAFRELAAANVVEILGLAANLAHQQKSLEPDARLIADAQHLLQSHLDQPVDLRHIAQSLGLKYDYFRRIFRHGTGLSPYQYHLQLRLTRAKRLLRDTPLPIRHVAELTGFANEYHFSRAFKKHAAMSPTAWRRLGNARGCS
jgi:AraC-like DNA-binding protein